MLSEEQTASLPPACPGQMKSDSLLLTPVDPTLDARGLGRSNTARHTACVEGRSTPDGLEPGVHLGDRGHHLHIADQVPGFQLLWEGRGGVRQPVTELALKLTRVLLARMGAVIVAFQSQTQALFEKIQCRPG
jgi:hypothetical protein